MKTAVVIALVFLFLLSACGRNVDARALPYLETFRQEAKDRGIFVSVDEISVEVDPELGATPAARCSVTALKKVVYLGPHIALDEYRLSTEAVIFHELGHCLLSREHTDEKSLMNSEVPIYLYPFSREEYLDELFSEVVKWW